MMRRRKNIIMKIFMDPSRLIKSMSRNGGEKSMPFYLGLAIK